MDLQLFRQYLPSDTSDWVQLVVLVLVVYAVLRLVRGTIAASILRGTFIVLTLCVFVAAFVRSHGSIKAMERVFGVSYPTIKNRLNRIAAQLPLAEVDVPPAPSASDLLGQLERGEITAREVLGRLRGNHDDE